MVDCQCEHGEAQEEVAALVGSPGSGHGFAFNGSIVLLSLVAESTSDCDGLPACLTAARSGAWAGATFLAQPVSNPKLGPVCSEAGGEGRVKHPNPMRALADNLSL